MARIKYNGPKNVKRVVGEYVFSTDNDQIAEVNDAKMVKTLLAQPNVEFTLVVEEDPTASHPASKPKKWKEN
jgi:hypothetical protein